jgi:leader peptidase (prepilin peptidase)/N-methyltransferase
MAAQGGQYIAVNGGLLLATIVAGVAAGGLANWAADTLPGPRKQVSEAAQAPQGGLAARRTPMLYAAMVIAFGVTAWLLGPDPIRVAIGCLYAAFLLTVLVIDFEHRRVLNIMLAPAAVIALALSLLPQTPLDLTNALVGGGVGLGLFVLVYLLSRGHLGMGDVKLAGVIGLMLGYPGVVNALMVGILMGAAAAIFLLVTRRATRKSYMAYAPYLALGTLFVLWWTW